MPPKELPLTTNRRYQARFEEGLWCREMQSAETPARVDMLCSDKTGPPPREDGSWGCPSADPGFYDKDVIIFQPLYGQQWDNQLPVIRKRFAGEVQPIRWFLVFHFPRSKMGSNELGRSRNCFSRRTGDVVGCWSSRGWGEALNWVISCLGIASVKNHPSQATKPSDTPAWRNRFWSDLRKGQLKL